MTFLENSMKLNLKRIFIVCIVYISIESIALILSVTGLYDFNIGIYEVTAIVFHVFFLLIVIKRKRNMIEQVKQNVVLVYVYITIIVAWSVTLTALIHTEESDITLMGIVLVVCSALFIIKPKRLKRILLANYIFYMSLVFISFDSQIDKNSMWFKGLLFFVLAYIISKVHYKDCTDLNVLSDQLDDSNHSLSDQANIDSLSGLYNNAYIYHHLENILNDHEMKESLSVLMMDIDNFKAINDEYGHLFGDTVIKSIAKELKDSTEDKDIIGRYGGEEFILILNQAKIEDTIYVAEVIRGNIENMTFKYPAKVTISIGIAFYNGESARELIKKADDQLYRAKSLGKNRVVREEEEQ